MEPHAMNPAANPWATAAAERPLAFSQVREDPRLDMEVARRLPTGARVSMIASGGETAVCMARLPLEQLVLVDMNPAQLALTRCRMHLARTSTSVENMKLLGHLPMSFDERRERWTEIFGRLDLADGVLGRLSLVAELGPDHCGRYEAAFAELRRRLQPRSAEIADFLATNDVQSASGMIATDTETGKALNSAFASALSLENLVALFGEAATQNPRQPFHLHFLQQLRDITLRLAPAQNPWIWQLLAGKFPPGTPADWLLDRSPILARPEYRCSPMREMLEDAEPGSIDFVHLSNILDWLSAEDAAATLSAAHRALKQGGFILIRQLNSSLEIPSLFPALRWHQEEGDRLQRMDRSFFYPTILLASRP
jgi:S-adenosylmethionine-diacylglycerol 3-amino-3-carboxypropyl transferase